jgi:hypothetical protein
VRLSTFSTFVQFNQTYENISCDFYYRAGNSRVSELVREEGRANGSFFDDSHDPWHVDHQEDHRKVVDQEDQRRFSRSVSFSGSQEEHEEGCGGSVAFCQRIGFTFSDSLI